MLMERNILLVDLAFLNYLFIFPADNEGINIFTENEGNYYMQIKLQIETFK